MASFHHMCEGWCPSASREEEGIYRPWICLDTKPLLVQWHWGKYWKKLSQLEQGSTLHAFPVWIRRQELQPLHDAQSWNLYGRESGRLSPYFGWAMTVFELKGEKLGNPPSVLDLFSQSVPSNISTALENIDIVCPFKSKFSICNVVLRDPHSRH